MKLHWVTLSIIALVSFAIMIVLYTMVSKKEISISLILAIGCIVPSIYYVIAGIQSIGKGPALSVEDVVIILIASLLSIAGNLAQFEASKIAPNAGLPFAVMSFQAALVTILSIFIFKSGITGLQIIGIILSACGVLCISIK